MAISTSLREREAAPPSTSEALLSTIHAYSSLIKALFQSIEQPGSRISPVTDVHASRQWSPASTAQIIDAITDIDQVLADRLATAHEHCRNDARIQQLVRTAKAKDRITRGAITQLDSMASQLDQIVQLGNAQIKDTQQAEQDPLPYDTLLAYAQRLSRYTSAPPGFRLPSLTQVPSSTIVDGGAAEAGAGADAASGSQNKITLGPEYNQSAKRAAGYYDPAMPSMPQEMPFPSDALMRQGILNTPAMLAGAPMAEEPAADAAPMDEDAAAAAAAAADTIPAAYSQLHEQQQLQRQEEEEEAFDLDLN